MSPAKYGHFFRRETVIVSRPFRAFIVCTGMVVAAGVLWFLVGQSKIRTTGQNPDDFVKYYLMSHRLIEGEAIYDPVALPRELEERLGWSYRIPARPADPPALVLCTYPFSLLPYPAAWWLLAGFSLAAIAICSYLACRECAVGRAAAVGAALLSLGTLPALVLLALNHIESLVLLLSTAGWLFFRRGRLTCGAVCWGLCAAFKLFPALWVLALLRLEEKKPFFIAVSAAAIATAIGALVLGFDETLRFVQVVIPQSGNWEVSYGNLALQSFAADFLGENWSPAVTALFTAGAMWILFSGHRGIDRLWLSALSLSLLLSPLGWSYYYVLLLPPAIVWISRMRSAGGGAFRVPAYLIFAVLFYWPSLLGGWVSEPAGGQTGSAPFGVAAFQYLPTAALILFFLSSALCIDREGDRRLAAAASDAAGAKSL